eukprot:4773774-Amphidinium_carterae.1
MSYRVLGVVLTKRTVAGNFQGGAVSPEHRCSYAGPHLRRLKQVARASACCVYTAWHAYEDQANPQLLHNLPITMGDAASLPSFNIPSGTPNTVRETKFKEVRLDGINR